MESGVLNVRILDTLLDYISHGLDEPFVVH